MERLSHQAAWEEAADIRQLLKSQKAENYSTAEILAENKPTPREGGAGDGSLSGEPVRIDPRVGLKVPKDFDERPEWERQAIVEILNARPDIELGEIVGGEQYCSVALTDRCKIVGTFDVHTKCAYIEDFYALVEKTGAGTRLLCAFAATAKEQGCQYLTGSIISEGGLRTRIRVFGPDNLEYYFEDELGHVRRLTQDAALAIIEAYDHTDQSDEDWIERGGRVMRVGVDLRKYDFKEFSEVESLGY